jgi:hypothetical protein
MTGVAFADNEIMKYLEKFDIRFIDRASNDLKFVYNPFVNQMWKLQLDMNKGTENQESARTKTGLNLGSIPEVLLRYQSNTVLQWGHPFGNSVLLLRIGAKPEDLAHIDFRNKADNAFGFNFLIDFWFK